MALSAIFSAQTAFAKYSASVTKPIDAANKCLR